MVPTTLCTGPGTSCRPSRVINANITEASPRGPNQPTDRLRDALIRHDGCAQGRVGGSQGGAEQQCVPRTDPEQQGAGDGTKGDCQRKAESEEPYATAEIGPQLRYADSAGVGEQHPHQGCLGDDLDLMRVSFNIEKVKTLSEHQPDRDEERSAWK